MKKLGLGIGLVALLFFVGCSKQPNLENAQIQENNKTTQKQITNQSQVEAKSEQIVTQPEQGVVQSETVNTENANVQEENLTATTIRVSKMQNNQEFAKKLASIVVYFDFDKYNIRPDQWPKVEKLAKLIKENPSNYTVRIEGNCDEWGTEEYNYALGLKRANSVKNALIKLGVDPKKLTIISYGELNPVCTAHARWCWRLNRRDNFTYLP